MNAESPSATTTETASNAGQLVRTIAAIIFAFIGIFGSVQLLRLKIIGELSFVSLVVIVLGVGVVIAFIDRVAWFGSPAFKVQMAHIEESRKEVQKREKRVTEIARIVSEVADWNIKNHGFLFGTAIIEENKKWLEKKNAELKSLIGDKE